MAVSITIAALNDIYIIKRRCIINGFYNTITYLNTVLKGLGHDFFIKEKFFFLFNV